MFNQINLSIIKKIIIIFAIAFGMTNCSERNDSIAEELMQVSQLTTNQDEYHRIAKELV